MPLCPCCSEKNYGECCQPFLNNIKSPANAEQLMRSRYTAYSLGDFDYIMKTMKPPALNSFNLQNARKKAKQIKWINLQILKSELFNPQKQFVEFIASFTEKNKTHTLHELSEFRFDDGRWFYVDGTYC